MSEYIRVRGQLYQAVDAVNGKMLNYLMAQLKPVLSSLSENGYVLSQNPTAGGVDIILHREGSVADITDARATLKHVRVAISSIKQKVRKISNLPFFKTRFGYSLGVTAKAEVSGRGPWHILSIEADQRVTMPEVLSKYQEEMTPRLQRPLYEGYKDDRALQALRYLSDYLVFDELSSIQERAKFLGRLEPQLARDINDFCKNILTQSRRLIAKVKDAHIKHKEDF